MRRRLVLVRHGRAEDGHPRGDHERRLVEEGERAAADLGAWLAAQGLAPGLVVVSTAARAQETLEHLLRGLGATREEVQAWPDARIYSGGAEGVLAAVGEAPDDVEVLWVVGHEPTLSTLGWELARSSGVAPAADLARGLPTATAAVLEGEVGWAEVMAQGLALTALHRGRPD